MWKNRLAFALLYAALLCACAVGLSGTEMPSVDRLRQSQKLIFKLISLWGIDAALGWETSAMRTRCRRLSPESTSV